MAKRRHRLGHRLFVLGFIASPLVVLAVLIQAILFSFENGPSMVAEPVGAGAGDTGGANAMGGSLFAGGEVARGIPAERTARGVELVLTDASGTADDSQPVVLLTNHTRWDPDLALPLSRDDRGLWKLILPPPAAGQTEPLQFRFALRTDAGEILREVDASGVEVGQRRLPRVSEEEAIGEEPLRYAFTAERFE